MRRLVAAGVLPERAGQPVKIWAHISLADLRRLEGSSALQQEWTWNKDKTKTLHSHGPPSAQGDHPRAGPPEGPEVPRQPSAW